MSAGSAAALSVGRLDLLHHGRVRADPGGSWSGDRGLGGGGPVRRAALSSTSPPFFGMYLHFSTHTYANELVNAALATSMTLVGALCFLWVARILVKPPSWLLPERS